jgi:hypothetical protein
VPLLVVPCSLNTVVSIRRAGGCTFERRSVAPQGSVTKSIPKSKYFTSQKPLGGVAASSSSSIIFEAFVGGQELIVQSS